MGSLYVNQGVFAGAFLSEQRRIQSLSMERFENISGNIYFRTFDKIYFEHLMLPKTLV